MIIDNGTDKQEQSLKLFWDWQQPRFKGPLAALLKEQLTRYTRGGSTARVEIAQLLAQGIIYTLEPLTKNTRGQALLYRASENGKLAEVYAAAQKELEHQVQATRLKYLYLRKQALPFSIQAYEDLIHHTLNTFFTAYNPRFLPQETPVIFDYGPYRLDRRLSGIRQVKSVIANLLYENTLLAPFGVDCVQDFLGTYARGLGPGYSARDLTDNIFALAYQQLLIQSLLGETTAEICFYADQGGRLADHITGLRQANFDRQLKRIIAEIVKPRAFTSPRAGQYLEGALAEIGQGLYLRTRNME